MEPRVRVLLDRSRADYRDPRSPRPIRVYEWGSRTPRPEPTPVVLLSHGNGGSGKTMDWLARPLTAAGFRVVAVDHHGNNVVDGYQPEGFIFGWDRPRDLSVVLDDLAGVGPLGPVGVAGFSFGGFTALAMAGGRIDTAAVAAVLLGQADPPDIPEFPGVLDALTARMSSSALRSEMEQAGSDLADPRVDAVFAIAPGWAHLLTPPSLRNMTVPVEVHWGGADRIAPLDEIRPYLDLIPQVVGHCIGPEVRHEDLIPAVVVDPAVRDRVGAAAADFFDRHLT
jgi:predicted dienelactone hydrolase